MFIDWKINQVRITELYCVNKNNPLMHCNGQCYLSKQLKKIESDYRESKLPFNPKNVKSTEFLLFIEQLTPDYLELLTTKSAEVRGGIYQGYSNQQYLASCFKPPCFSNYNTLTA